MTTVAEFKERLKQSVYHADFHTQLDSIISYYQRANSLSDADHIDSYFIRGVFENLSVSYHTLEDAYWEKINSIVQDCLSKLERTSHWPPRGTAARGLSFTEGSRPVAAAAAAATAAAPAQVRPSSFLSQSSFSMSSASLSGNDSGIFPGTPHDTRKRKVTSEAPFQSPAKMRSLSTSYPNSPTTPMAIPLSAAPGSPAHSTLTEKLKQLALQRSSGNKFDIPLVREGILDHSMLDEIRANNLFYFNACDFPHMQGHDAFRALSFNLLQAQWATYLNTHNQNFPSALYANFILKMLFQLKDNPCLMIFEFIREYLRHEDIVLLRMQPLNDIPYFTLYLQPSESSTNTQLHYTLQFRIKITQLIDGNGHIFESTETPPLQIELLARIVLDINHVNITLEKCKFFTSLDDHALNFLLPNLAEIIETDFKPDNPFFKRVKDKCASPLYKSSYCFQGPTCLLDPAMMARVMPDFNNTLLDYAVRNPVNLESERPGEESEAQRSLRVDLNRSGMNFLADIPDAAWGMTLQSKLAVFERQCQLFNPQIKRQLLDLIPQSTLNPFHYCKTNVVSYFPIACNFSIASNPSPPITMWLKQKLGEEAYLKCLIDFNCLSDPQSAAILNDNLVPLFFLTGRIYLNPLPQQAWHQFWFYIEPMAIDVLKSTDKWLIVCDQFLNFNNANMPPFDFIYQVNQKKRELWPFYYDKFKLEEGLHVILLGVEPTADDTFSGRRAVLGGEYLQTCSFEQVKAYLMNIKFNKGSDLDLIKNKLLSELQLSQRMKDRSPQDLGAAQKLPSEADFLFSLSKCEIWTKEYLTLLQYTALSQGCWMVCFQQKAANATYPQGQLELIYNEPKPHRNLETICILLNKERTHFDRLKASLP